MGCNYSNKFLPLIEYNKRALSKEDFRTFINTYFNNGDAVYSMFADEIGTDGIPADKRKGIKDATKIDTRKTFIATTNGNNTSAAYLGRSEAHSNMIKKFKKEILERTRLKINFKTGEVTDIQSNAIVTNGITVINKNLFQYKIDLINKIRKETDPDFKLIDPNDLSLSNEELTKLINDTLSISEITDNVFDDYIILANFDALIKSEAPYVKIKEKYDGATVDSINKYEYVGSTVQHFTGWTSNEFADSMDQATLLIKSILDYIPELNNNGQIIEGSSIGLSGFYSCMSAMRTSFLYYSDNEMLKVRDELKKGVKGDFYKIIDAYINYLTSSKAQDRTVSSYYNAHKTYLIGKLKGIQQFIFNSKLDEDIVNIFKEMFFKNVQMEYVGYTKDQQSKSLMGIDLKSNFINNQTYALIGEAASAIYKFRTNIGLYNSLVGSKNQNSEYVPKYIVTNDDRKSKSYTIEFNNKKFEITNGQISENSFTLNEFKQIFFDLLGYTIPDDYELVGKQINGDNWNASSNLGELLKITVEGVFNWNFKKFENNYPTYLTEYYTTFAEIGKIMSVIYGSDVANVVKNINKKNNLPLFGLNSLVNNFPYIMWDHMENTDNSIYSNPNEGFSSFLFEEIGTKPSKNGIPGEKFFIKKSLVGEPKIRSEILQNGQIKKASKLTVSEVLRLSILNDFYQNLSNDESDHIYLQNATFADKSTHFLVNYKIDEAINFYKDGKIVKKTIRELLKEHVAGTNDDIFNLLYETRSNRINKLVENILNDYNKVYNKKLKTLDDLKRFLKNYKFDTEKYKDIQSAIRHDFLENNINFYEEIHLSKGKVNETIELYYNTFRDKTKLQERLAEQRKAFISDLIKNKFHLNQNFDSNTKKIGEDYKDWLDPISGEIKLFKEKDNKIILHPVLEQYFMADVLLSNEYNEVMIGGVYAHSKNSESSRLIAQIKRSVIYGATIHSLAQNLENGVADTVKIAVMSDLGAPIQNLVGDSKIMDSMDGSGLSTALEARLESNSLLDARTGYDKKTIGHDIDSKYGRPSLLKWAVYAMTNARRRIAFKSKASQELLCKKAYSAGTLDQVTADELNEILSNIGETYYYDIENSGRYYKIKGFEETENGLVKKVVIADYKTGAEIKDSEMEIPINITTLWDIDQAFGGAWAMNKSESGLLTYNEANVDALEYYVTLHQDAKTKQIGYLVNKSAMKVGAGNLNEQEAWMDKDIPLHFITMRTKYIGVQMDAEHDLDEAEVTEMTQMISALSENGYTAKTVNKIYTDIGEVIVEALKKYDDAINTNDYKQIYKLLGEAFIKSFENNDRDTLGLAQAFVLKATKAFKEGNYNFKLPFSADTVNGIFISTVSSMLTKKGIRRKYEGFAGVLTPSYNMIQYYRLGNKTYMFEEFANEVRKKIHDENQVLSGGDIVFGHPGIGKTYSTINGNYNHKFIDWDDEFNEVRDKWIEDHTGTIKGTEEFKKAKHDLLVNYADNKEFIEFVSEEWKKAKHKAFLNNKVLFASSSMLIDLFKNDFNFVINLSDQDFINRKINQDQNTNPEYIADLQNWKSNLNNLLTSIKAPSITLNEGQYFEDYLTQMWGENDRSFIERAMNDYFINGKLNPFLKEITDYGSIDFEDTIVLQDKETGEFEEIYVNDYKKYDYVKHKLDLTKKIVYNFTSKPKNLKGTNTIFKIEVNDVLDNSDIIVTKNNKDYKHYINLGAIDVNSTLNKNEHFGNPFENSELTEQQQADEYEAWLTNKPSTITGESLADIEPKRRKWIVDQLYKGELKDKNLIYKGSDLPEYVLRLKKLIYRHYNTCSIYDIDSVRANFYFNDKNRSEEETEYIKSVLSAWGYDSNLEDKEYVNSSLQKITQSCLRSIDKHQKIKLLVDGKLEELNTIDHRVVPAELITGKYHFKEFMIEEGDSINDLFNEQDPKKGYEFFYKKLKNKYKWPTNLDMSTDFIDEILFTKKGEPIITKILSKEKQLEFIKKYNLIEHTQIEKIDDSWYLNDELIIKSSNIKFYQYNSGDQIYTVVIADSDKDLQKLKHTSYIDVYRKNYTKQEDIDKEIKQFNNFLQRKSKSMFDSFIRQRQMIGTRIPTQAMQSFMPMTVVGYTDSLVNDVYVPVQQCYLQGSDYDIDKGYILAFAVDDSGIIYTNSNLSKYGYDLHELFKLNNPNGIEYKKSKIKTDKTFELSSHDLKTKRWVNIINQIMKSDVDSIYFSDYSNNTKKVCDDFLHDLNIHTLTKLNSNATDLAIKNKVVWNILRVSRNLQNQIISQISVDSTTQIFKDAVKDCELAKYEKTITSDNPAVKFMMQVQNMVGKEVISSAAVSLKQFFAKTAYYNDYISNFFDDFSFNFNSNSKTDIETRINGKNELIRLCQEICKYNPVYNKLTVLSNLNFIDSLEDTDDYRFTVDKYYKTRDKFRGANILRNADFSVWPNAINYNPNTNTIIINEQLLIDKFNKKVWRGKSKHDFKTYEDYATWCLYWLENTLYNNNDSSKSIEYADYMYQQLLDVPPIQINEKYFSSSHDLLEWMNNESMKVDAALTISAILSLATDNAKELTLSKLNATSNLVDIYTYLLSLGTKPKDIISIMTSSSFEYIAKLSEGDIFNPMLTSVSVLSALKFYLNENTISDIDIDSISYIFSKLENKEDLISKKETWKKLFNGLNNINESNKNIINAIDYCRNRVKELKAAYYAATHDQWGEPDWDNEPEEDIDIEPIEYLDQEDIEVNNSKPRRNFKNDPLSIQDYLKLIQFFELCLDRNQNYINFKSDSELNKAFNELKIIENTLKGVKEQKMLGSSLGINQGLKTKTYDKWSFQDKINNYINGIVKKEGKKKGYTPNFDLFTFMKDENYRNWWINVMDELKYNDNILKICVSVPHFSEMFKTWYVDESLLRATSARYNLESYFAKKVKPNPTYKLNEFEYNQIKYYVNDLLIINWLSMNNFQIPVDPDQKVYIDGKLKPTKSGTIELNSRDGISSFKYLMDNWIIPELKKQYPDNQFLKDINLTSDYNKVTGEIKSYHKLPIGMMDASKSPSIEAKYNIYLNAFNDISDKTFKNMKIGDLFYLYNLIVNKDSFGQKSLTRIFENLVNSQSGSFLVNDFNKWLGELDGKSIDELENIINFNLDDLKFRIVNHVKDTKVKLANKNYKTNADNTFELPLLLNNSILLNPDQTPKQISHFKNLADSININEYRFPFSYIVKAFINNDNSEKENIIFLTSDDYKNIANDNFDRELFDVETFNYIKNNFDFVENQNSFICNGQIYINLDNASITDILHEHTHLILAKLKWNEDKEIRKKYYDIVSKINNHPLFNEIAKQYPNVYGSDLQEEVFVNLLQNLLDNKLNEWDSEFFEEFNLSDDSKTKHNIAKQINHELHELVNYVFNLSMSDDVPTENLSLLDAIKLFGNNDFYNAFLDNETKFILKKHQKIMNFKDRLIKNNELKLNCE